LNVIAIGATTGSNSFRADQSITGSLVVSSTITAQTLVVQTVTSSIIYSSGSNVFGCDLNSRQTFTGSLNVTGSNHTIFGNVGIGTSSPNSYSGYTTLTINNTTTGAVLDLNRSGTRTGTFYADTSGVGIGSLIATNLDIFTGNSYIAFQTCGLERMRITSAGCIGIGNTSPTYQLDMCSGTTVNQRIRLQRGSDDTNQNMLLGWNNIVLTRSNVTIAGNQTDFSIIQCGCDGIRTPFYIDVLGRTCFACNVMIGNTGCYFELANDGGGAYIENHGNTVAKSVIRIQTSKCNDTTNYSQFIIDPYCGFTFRGLNGGNENVGIGTTNPSAKLTILRSGSSLTTLGQSRFLNITDDYGAANSRTEIGFGYTAQGTATNIPAVIGYLQTSTSAYTKGDLYFATRDATTDSALTERLRITAAGNVGIGTCTPTGILQLSSENSGNTQMLLVRNYATSATGNFTGCYIAEIRGTSNGCVRHAMLINNEENDSTRRVLDITSTFGTIASFVSNGNVGIGTLTPSYKLEVQKTSANVPAIFINQCSANEATIRFKSTHSCMSDYRIGASIAVSNTFEIYNVQCNRTNYMVNCLGYSKMSPDGTFVNGNNTNYHSMNSSGEIILYGYNTNATGNGILSNVQSCSTSYYSFRGYSDPYGDMAFIYSNGTFGSRTGTYGGLVSDARCKTEICDASSQWSDIKNLRVRNFKLIEDVENDPINAMRQIGFIAQEVETVSPGLVFESGNGCVDSGCWKNVKTSIIHTKAVKALQEAMCRIEILESCLGIS
jgi:hypothetical protein